MEDERFWRSQWGDNIIFSHGTSHSAGTAFLFNNCPGKICFTRSDNLGHWLLIVLSIDNTLIIMGNIYGFNSVAQNKNLLRNITEEIHVLKKSFSTDNVILGGDFNMCYDDWLDRHPSKFSSHYYNPVLVDLCDYENLLDPWRYSNLTTKQYSWFKSDLSCKSRIDFWLISSHIQNFVHGSLISAAPLADHCSVSLELKSPASTQLNRGYWKFNTSLLDNKLFCKGVGKIIVRLQSAMAYPLIL